MKSKKFTYDGHSYCFHIMNEKDAIQKHHFAGELFDVGELHEMAKHIKDGDVIADVGANVGNHTIFFAKNFPKSTIIPFEPNNEAILLLNKNLASNNCPNVDNSYIGNGLSEQNVNATSWRNGGNNLGGSKVLLNLDIKTVPTARQDNFHDISLLKGDDVFKTKNVDFLKIDVEGHEFEVLAGLKKTIKRDRPKIFIEIWNENKPRFSKWIKSNKYKIIFSDSRYAKVQNHLIIPL